jgi:hypothetical protein
LSKETKREGNDQIPRKVKERGCQREKERYMKSREEKREMVK